MLDHGVTVRADDAATAMNSSAAAAVVRLVRESFRDTHLCNVVRPFSRTGFVRCTQRATARTMWIEVWWKLLQAEGWPSEGRVQVGEPNVRQLEPGCGLALRRGGAPSYRVR